MRGRRGRALSPRRSSTNDRARGDHSGGLASFPCATSTSAKFGESRTASARASARTSAVTELRWGHTLLDTTSPLGHTRRAGGFLDLYAGPRGAGQLWLRGCVRRSPGETWHLRRGRRRGLPSTGPAGRGLFDRFGYLSARRSTCRSSNRRGSRDAAFGVRGSSALVDSSHVLRWGSKDSSRCREPAGLLPAGSCFFDRPTRVPCRRERECVRSDFTSLRLEPAAAVVLRWGSERLFSMPRTRWAPASGFRVFVQRVAHAGEAPRSRR